MASRQLRAHIVLFNENVTLYFRKKNLDKYSSSHYHHEQRQHVADTRKLLIIS